MCNTSCILSYCQVALHRMYITHLLTCLSVDGHLRSCTLFDYSEKWLYARFYMDNFFSLSLAYKQRSGIAGSCSSFSVFKDLPKCFPSDYAWLIPISIAWGLQSASHFPWHSSCVFDYSCPDGCEVLSPRGFNFSIVCLFSCTYWKCVFIILENVFCPF